MPSRVSGPPTNSKSFVRFFATTLHHLCKNRTTLPHSHVILTKALILINLNAWLKLNLT